ARALRGRRARRCEPLAGVLAGHPPSAQADDPGRAAVPNNRRGAHVRFAARAHQRGARQVDRNGGAVHLQHLLHVPEFRLWLHPGGGDLPYRHVRQLHLYQGARRADPRSTAMTRVPLRSTGQAHAPLRSTGFYAFVAGFVAFCLAPFVWTFLTSLKGPTTIYEVPIRYLPTPADLINYREIFGLDRFRWALLNSTILASSATAISLVIGSLCAYAIARLNFPFKNLLLALVLAIAMFPGIAIIGPLFREFNAWGLTNNYLALILPNVTFTLPICIWTLTAFFSDLPAELEESARVDG